MNIVLYLPDAGFFARLFMTGMVLLIMLGVVSAAKGRSADKPVTLGLVIVVPLLVISVIGFIWTVFQ